MRQQSNFISFNDKIGHEGTKGFAAAVGSGIFPAFKEALFTY